MCREGDKTGKKNAKKHWLHILFVILLQFFKKGNKNPIK